MLCISVISYFLRHSVSCNFPLYQHYVPYHIWASGLNTLDNIIFVIHSRNCYHIDFYVLNIVDRFIPNNNLYLFRDDWMHLFKYVRWGTVSVDLDAMLSSRKLMGWIGMKQMIIVLTLVQLCWS